MDDEFVRAAGYLVGLEVVVYNGFVYVCKAAPGRCVVRRWQCAHRWIDGMTNEEWLEFLTEIAADDSPV